MNRPSTELPLSLPPDASGEAAQPRPPDPNGWRGAWPLLVCAAMLAISWLALLAMGVQGRLTDTERTLDRAELMARVLADYADRNVEAAAQAAATLAELSLSGLEPSGPEMSTAIAQTLVNLPFLRGIALLEEDGTVLASNEPRVIGKRIPMQVFGPLPEARRDRVGALVQARTLSQLMQQTPAPVLPAGVSFLPLLRVVPQNSGRTQLIVMMLNPQAFTTYFEVFLENPNAAAVLAGYDGRLIAATSQLDAMEPGTQMQDLTPYTQYLPAREQASWVGRGLRAGTQLAAFHVAATRPLVVIVEYSRAELLEAAGPRERALQGAGAAALLLFTVLGLLWRRNLRSRTAAQSAIASAQAELARSERALSVTVKSVQELIFRCDSEGRLTYANERWQAISGEAARLAVGRSLAELTSQEHQAALRDLFDGRGPSGMRRLQAPILAADGVRREFEIAVLPLQEEGRIVGYAGSAVDITEQVWAQRGLQAQLSFNRRLMDLSPLPMSLVGLNRQYLLVNQAWEAFTGRRRELVVGQPVGTHLPEKERALHEEEDAILLSTGQARRYEARLRHHDGSLRDVQVNKLLLPGADGRPSGVLSVLADVTELRNAERATREARDVAEGASRMKSEFIANISHELRTPLQAIIGFSELAQLRSSGDERLQQMLQDIHAAGQRMLALVNDLLDLAKLDSGIGAVQHREVDLVPVVHSVVQELQPLLLRKQLRLQVQMQAPALPALADEKRLQQVLRNLLANAIKFSPAGGEIECRGELMARASQDEPQAEPAPWLRLLVCDRGPGIPPQELEAIFEAFVQSSKTKDGAGGTGLGLAICRKIASAHGGSVRAFNRPGGGACFELLLPPLPVEPPVQQLG